MHPRPLPDTRILVRGDSHGACPRAGQRPDPDPGGRAEVMAWCEDNAIDYVFGLAGNKVLKRLVDASADDIRTRL